MIIEDNKTKPLGNLNGHKLGSGYAGSVYDTDGLPPTINTMGGGSREPMIVEDKIICRQAGRNPDNPSDRTAGIPTEQRLEPNSQGICNTITTVQKDCMVLEKSKQYRVRKLTPREAFRLMSFSDEDFDKAAAVNSNTQLYKTCGNSIARTVLCAIFSQLNIKGVKPWNEMSQEERLEIITSKQNCVEEREDIGMKEDTFEMLVGILDDEQLQKLHDEGMFTERFIFILETEMFKRCMI